MKKIFLLFFVGAFALTTTAQKNEFTIKADPDAGVFEFETEVLDYGKISPESDRDRVFTFKNVGNGPIIITNAKGSCGCAVPVVPKRPIMPGETAEIGVKYTTKRAGKFSKTITIYSNASRKTIKLIVKGEVVGGATNAKASLEKPKSLMSAN